MFSRISESIDSGVLHLFLIAYGWLTLARFMQCLQADTWPSFDFLER